MIEQSLCDCAHPKPSKEPSGCVGGQHLEKGSTGSVEANMKLQNQLLAELSDKVNYLASILEPVLMDAKPDGCKVEQGLPTACALASEIGENNCRIAGSTQRLKDIINRIDL